MTLRRRVVALSGLAVAVAVAVVSIATYVLVRNELLDRVDSELRKDATETATFPLLSSGRWRLATGGPGTDRGHAALVPAHGSRAKGAPKLTPRLFLPSGPLGGHTIYAQLVDEHGRVIRPRGPRTDLGALATAIAVARGQREPTFTDARTHGLHLRVYTAPLGRGEAIQVARPLDDVDATLSQLRVILLLVSLGGVVLAGGLGYAVSRAAVAPVERLRRAAQQVASTRDLGRRIQAGGGELGALAASFNSMLEALQGALDAQRQLVADASHELRTPLAILRTNVEVMAQADLLSEDERRALLADVLDQLEELTALVGDLIELARDPEHSGEPPEDVRLDRVVASVV